MKEPTDDEMIIDIQRVAHLLNTNALSLSAYLANGGKYSKEIIDDFDGSSFANKCELAGLKNKMNG